jgi:hypothetical protein
LTQTNEIVPRDALTQTIAVDTKDEDSQTASVYTFDAPVQVNIKPPLADKGCSPDKDILEAAYKEIETTI